MSFFPGTSFVVACMEEFLGQTVLLHCGYSWNILSFPSSAQPVHWDLLKKKTEEAPSFTQLAPFYRNACIPCGGFSGSLAALASSSSHATLNLQGQSCAWSFPCSWIPKQMGGKMSFIMLADMWVKGDCPFLAYIWVLPAAIGEDSK